MFHGYCCTVGELQLCPSHVRPRTRARVSKNPRLTLVVHAVVVLLCLGACTGVVDARQEMPFRGW